MTGDPYGKYEMYYITFHGKEDNILYRLSCCNGRVVACFKKGGRPATSGIVMTRYNMIFCNHQLVNYDHGDMTVRK